MNDLDELELEERERQAKKKLSDRFLQFSKIVEAQSRKCPQPIEFDVPIADLWFMGCPKKAAVKIRATARNCLIAITEQPFFVIDVRDIEAVHFERVAFGIKNFDMAIIFKDFYRFERINSIPRESIEELKTYLDRVGIVFSEGLVPMNWATLLGKIRQDFEGFLEKEGAWKFLHEDAGEDEDGEEGSEMADGDFEDDGSSSSSEDDESDYSSDGDGDDASDYGDSDEASEGLSWDEMEKRAREEDRKAAQRRQQNNQAPSQP
jgi:nucleosome binding factor SPN SPT16 subunit